MPPLAELQAHVRDAMLTGDAGPVASALVGARDARHRFAIHQRHYAASLVTALLGRFPATVWLAGSEFVRGAAERFVRDHPPSRPCIAEYGEAFPAFLPAQPEAHTLPYLGQFAELEWHLGRLSLATDRAGLGLADLSRFAADALPGATVTLQPGMHLLRADWAIDALMTLYLQDDEPDQFTLEAGEVWLELRGSRGELRINRLSPADFAFRAALLARVTIGDAAVGVLDLDAAFDAGRALVSLLDERAIVTIDLARPSLRPSSMLTDGPRPDLARSAAPCRC